jgi:hypothetical protein
MFKLLFSILSVFAFNVLFAQDFEKFYVIIQKNSKSELENGLKKVSAISDLDTKNVYKGALQTKLAQFGSNPIQKLQLFNGGVENLEKSIKKNPNNIEFRFIRLIIQENCPSFLMYKSNIENDALFISKNYKKASSYFQDCVFEYSKKSKYLSL